MSTKANTVAEARIRQAETASAITALLSAFSRDTGLIVGRVEVNEVLSYGNSVDYIVRLEVTL